MVFIKGQTSPNKGRRYSDELKKKLSDAHKGQKAWNKGLKATKPKSEEERKRISERMKGKKYALGTKLSEEHKINLSKIAKEKGFGKWMKGKRLSEEHVANIKKSIPRGDKCNFWAGGITDSPYSIDWTFTLKRSIRERDHYLCKVCLSEGNVVHHIDYDKFNCNPTNLITLCVKCHAKTNTNREKWITYFK